MGDLNHRYRITWTEVTKRPFGFGLDEHIHSHDFQAREDSEAIDIAQSYMIRNHIDQNGAELVRIIPVPKVVGMAA
jgi:hypothetical protein